MRDINLTICNRSIGAARSICGAAFVSDEFCVMDACRWCCICFVGAGGFGGVGYDGELPVDAGG